MLMEFRECRFNLTEPSLTDEEITFLEGYVRIMKPIAIAMDVLQSETDMDIGMVIFLFFIFF